MRSKMTWILGVTLVFVTGTVAAQSTTDHPGYFPVEEMGILDGGNLKVDVDLQGAMLQLVSAAMKEEEDDAGLADMVSNLERVRVQVGSIDSVDVATVASRIDDAVSRLTASGWDQILKVVEEGEQVYLFAREDAGSIVGLTVLVNDGGEEAVVVNIVGTIDPSTLGRMLSDIGEIPDLKKYIDVVE